MRDIETKSDINFLMNEFYDKVLSDKLIGYFFTDVIKLDLEHHLPLITDFWSNILFHSGDYKKNVLQIHKNINTKSPLLSKHFEQWLYLLDETISQNYKGKKAKEMLTKAKSIALVMQSKII